MRRVLTPKWLAFHLLAVVLVLVMLRLGWWQWHRAESTSGTLQNIGYAFEWPVFAGFVVFMWWKTIRDDQRRHRASQDAPSSSEPARDTERPPVVGRTAPAQATSPEEDDEELVAYNAYLADLNARGGRRVR